MQFLQRFILVWISTNKLILPSVCSDSTEIKTILSNQLEEIQGSIQSSEYIKNLKNMKETLLYKEMNDVELPTLINAASIMPKLSLIVLLNDSDGDDKSYSNENNNENIVNTKKTYYPVSGSVFGKRNEATLDGVNKSKRNNKDKKCVYYPFNGSPFGKRSINEKFIICPPGTHLNRFKSKKNTVYPLSGSMFGKRNSLPEVLSL